MDGGVVGSGGREKASVAMKVMSGLPTFEVVGDWD